MNRSTKFWIGVACKDHVENGVKWEICQFGHGSIRPSKLLKKGDFVIYYSSKISMESSELYQKFTAIGQVIDHAPYQVEMENGFKPYRRDIKYFDAHHVDIKPLIPSLSFIKNKTSWGYVFRYGFLEINQDSFKIIATSMIGKNPLLSQ